MPKIITTEKQNIFSARYGRRGQITGAWKNFDFVALIGPGFSRSLRQIELPAQRIDDLLKFGVQRQDLGRRRDEGRGPAVDGVAPDKNARAAHLLGYHLLELMRRRQALCHLVQLQCDPAWSCR